MDWRNRFLWIFFTPINFDGLIGFILFLLFLLALLLWGIYLLAQLLIPMLVLALLILAAIFVPFHFWSKLTLEVRARDRIARALEEIRLSEQIHTPRSGIVPLEGRLRDSAQALVDRLLVRLRRMSPSADPGDRLAVQRELEDLTLGYAIVPSATWWSRFRRLHLERDWIRWLAEHPGAARYWLLGGLAIAIVFAFAVAEVAAQEPSSGSALIPEATLAETRPSLRLRPPLTSYQVSSPFASRRCHPILGYCRPHWGVDLAAPLGSPVYAAAPGIVEFAGWNGGAGRMIRLRHIRGLVTSYLHLDRILVGVGDRVAAGERIGTVGATGLVTGPHLHFSLQRYGEHLDPLTLLEEPP